MIQIGVATEWIINIKFYIHLCEYPIRYDSNDHLNIKEYQLIFNK